MLLAYRFLLFVHEGQAATLNAASGGTEQDIQHLQWLVSMCTLSLQVEVCPSAGTAAKVPVSAPAAPEPTMPRRMAPEDAAPRPAVPAPPMPEGPMPAPAPTGGPCGMGGQPVCAGADLDGETLPLVTSMHYSSELLCVLCMHNS